MFRILCDAYIDPTPTEAAEVQVDDQGKNEGTTIMLGSIIFIVIILFVILDRAVIRETKKKKAETDDTQEEETK